MATATAPRKLTVAEAAEQYEKWKPKLERAETEVKQAETVLKEHFAKHPAWSSYKGRIACARSTRTVLDQGLVKRHLGKALGRFQRKVPVLSLSLIERDGEADG